MPYITSKGQVTIPKPIREALGIAEGDAVDFTLKDGEAVIRRRGRTSWLTLGGIASAKGGGKGGDDESSR